MHTQQIYALLIRKCLHFLQRGQQCPSRPRPETSRPRPQLSRPKPRPRPEPSRPRPRPLKIGLETSQDRDRSRDFNIPASDCQTPSGQIPVERDRGIDGYGGKDIEIRSVLR